MAPIIHTEKLRKVYAVGKERVIALNNVDLSIEKGEFCCIVGQSGSGKSTLLNQLAGLEKPTSGKVFIGRHEISAMTENELAAFRQQHLGFIFQSYNLLPTMTAAENVALPLMFKGVDKKTRLARARKELKAMGLLGRANHLPMNNVVTVTVNAPWVESYYDRTEVCDVPASLDKQARAALASAYYFQYHWFGMHAGFMPFESVEGLPGWLRGYATDGAFYTKFSEFSSFLHTVYSDAWVDDMLSMDPAPFAEGENDTILTLDGDRGGNIAYCGHLFTEPELQPDGSLAFWQLSLTCESDDFKGWAGEETIVPDTATVTAVRLVPTENGWRVDALELPS